VTAAAKVNNIAPDISVGDYFVHSENARLFWVVLVVVCISRVCSSKNN